MTPQEQRKIRLQNDYQEMLNIKGNVVDWKVTKGSPPYVEAYELTVRVRTIIGKDPKYRSEHAISVELPANYPSAPPQTHMRTKPQPFHPNWYSSGNWCYGSWDFSESLGHHVIRMIQTLQFDLDITNPNSPANSEANRWYESNQGKGLFPCDNTVLPDPTKKKKFEVVNKPRKKFQIK